MQDNTAYKSILLLAANPKGTYGLRLQEEEREIRERLRLAGYGKTPINSTGATRPRDIQQAMLDFKPQLVHFSGHGAEAEGLVFEDMIGQEKLVDSAALANLFRLFSNRVECVVLNACYSKFQAEAISRHIEYVIGMSQAIGDRAAIEFSVGFYSALGAGEAIDFAYELGCNAIQLEGFPEELTPVLYKKGKLLQIYIGNRILKDNCENHEEQEVILENLASNLSHSVPRNRSSSEIPKVPKQQIQTSTSTKELVNIDSVVLGLIDEVFDALSNPNLEMGIKKFEVVAHKSLFRDSQIDPGFCKNCFKVAATRLNLYKHPAEILRSEPTGRTKLGQRGNKEDGREEKYIVALKDNVGGFEGSIRIFFPANNGPARVSGLKF